MRCKNAFYAQSGGVTAVINASAAGVIETARQHPTRIGTVYAGRNGILGALDEDLIDTRHESAADIAALRHTPGGAFGSCRYKLQDLQQHRAEYQRLIEVFKAHDIGYFFYNGGGDSADTCLKVAQLSAALGYPIQAIHIPKTVDNDLPITDCCPGFGSVAKYVATSIREAGYDVASMAKTSTKVFILEVMGRHAGRHHPAMAGQRQFHGSCAQCPGLLDIHCRSQMAGRALQIIGHGPMVFITQCALDQIGQHWRHAAQLGMAKGIGQPAFGNKAAIGLANAF